MIRNLYFAVIMENLEIERSFLNSFDRTDSKLIDLHDSASSADFPDFWIIIFANFH
jgi:hypothetical protein